MKINPRDAFKRFDENGDGKISNQEFKRAFKMMRLGYSDTDVEEILSIIDKSSDGSIDYNEFFKALRM